MNDTADQASRYCPYFNRDTICVIMAQLKTESDSRCKYWRGESDPKRCRYFELHVLKRGGRR